jgi:hypothetical protein
MIKDKVWQNNVKLVFKAKIWHNINTRFKDKIKGYVHILDKVRGIV